jgi:tungstate transport system ATP-binding protein
MESLPTAGPSGRKKIFSLSNFVHCYGRRKALDIEAFDVEEGSVVGLAGPNGSGKSTLLKAMAFLLPLKPGEVFFDGAPAAGREKELRRDVTLLLQDPFLLRRSVRENIAYGLRMRKIPPKEIDHRVSDSLSRVGLAPGDFAKRPWFRLSGGEAQRVSLAVRLALRPRVLLLDEPTANVDESSAVLIKQAVARAWGDWRTTIVVATHDLSWLHEVATGIVGMYAGRTISDGAANLVEGDWRVARDGRFASVAIGGAEIIALAPSGKNPRCAVLSPSDITVDAGPAGARDGCNFISGVLAQMSTERASGGILGVVDCGGLSLRARLSRSEVQELRLCPGMRVTLSFHAADLKFIHLD